MSFTNPWGHATTTVATSSTPPAGPNPYFPPPALLKSGREEDLELLVKALVAKLGGSVALSDAELDAADETKVVFDMESDKAGFVHVHQIPDFVHTDQEEEAVAVVPGVIPASIKMNGTFDAAAWDEISTKVKDATFGSIGTFKSSVTFKIP